MTELTYRATRTNGLVFRSAKTYDVDAPGAWVDEAICHPDTAEMWHHPESHDETRDAVEACTACPVRRDCARFALAMPEQTTGVWAGIYMTGRPRVDRPKLELVAA